MLSTTPNTEVVRLSPTVVSEEIYEVLRRAQLSLGFLALNATPPHQRSDISQALTLVSAIFADACLPPADGYPRVTTADVRRDLRLNVYESLKLMLKNKAQEVVLTDDNVVAELHTLLDRYDDEQGITTR